MLFERVGEYWYIILVEEGKCYILQDVFYHALERGRWFHYIKGHYFGLEDTETAEELVTSLPFTYAHLSIFCEEVEVFEERALLQAIKYFFDIG